MIGTKPRVTAKTEIQNVKTVPMPFSTVDAEAISLIAMKHSGNPGDLIHNLILVTLLQQPEDLRRN